MSRVQLSPFSEKTNFELGSYPRNAYERLPVYQFWYQVYYKEMQRKITDLDHSKKIISDDLEPDSNIFTLKQNNKIIASVRLSVPEEINNSIYFKMLKNFTNPSSIFLTKLMVQKDKRRLGLGEILLKKAEEFAAYHNKKTIILDCNDYMTLYFSKSGFSFITNNAIKSPHYGEVYLMKKDI